MAFQLTDVVPWGRTFDEYVAMFALDETDRSRSILGCGDGPASFNAEALQRNIKVVSADPLYQFSVPQIRKRIADTAPMVARQTKDNAQDFVWNRFKSVTELVAARMNAMQVFLTDFEAGLEQGRYVPAELPNLPFFDGTFDLALCSHFLFLYSEHHDAQFHIQALRELCRVAQEVRIFPLLELSGAPSRHLPQVMNALEAGGCTVKIEPVNYEFQKGGNQMLRLVGA
jgi:SAM-dependent methyltransferase